ncbi:unnamed protein product [Blumeria hordei]|uniref:Uncharacterized protein n=4 Tax=Blumeria TaxID=34372 RepID=A0A383UY10_BLUHO|nr:hypothetical protein BGHDH14_bgh06074 [Blumeria hordei DH14]SZF05243.1 unnamed protein product [Blumeria hordei]
MRPSLIRSATQAFKASESHILKKGAKKDPELWVLLGVMSGAFGLAGYYFGRKPTSSTSETKIAIADGSMPWQMEAGSGNTQADFKYRYHPGADPRNPPEDAPSALNVVVVPNVTLPKELHDKFNKWGKDGY